MCVYVCVFCEGFLCNETAGIHGNMGLLDQLEALRWIHRYISCFGGDPDNITLFGESAGGISISSHVLSPMAKGLFHRAICQSGTILYPTAAWTRKQSNKYWMKRLKQQGRFSMYIISHHTQVFFPHFLLSHLRNS